MSSIQGKNIKPEILVRKGLLGYNTKEVDEFIKVAVAKDRVRVANAI